ncbi:MAG: SpoIIE family protein phosphatase, partial [Erysipelotrichaceae bacterium]|nr:SpoIIE family protein phosphatase [Erysipelotrichaceae bacterium]
MDFFIETGYSSVNHVGEELCGDRVEMISTKDATIVVLADGLGSGVKANILSTLTSKIISTMMMQGCTIEECVETIASTLPVCNVRKVAYSTFSILMIDRAGKAYLAQFDSPSMFYIRNGRCWNYPTTIREINGKKIFESQFDIQLEDMMVMVSDGVIHAGIGNLLNFGWEYENVAAFIETAYHKNRSAKTMAAMVVNTSCELYDNQPGDDTTAAAIHIRENHVINILLGPPADPSLDEMVMQKFLGNPGKHIVSGGTTSSMVARYLNEEVETDLSYIDPEIPPIGHMKGVDLVTEGVLTFNRVMEISNHLLEPDYKDVFWLEKKDGASIICRLLFEEATEIHFFVGRAMNPAH